MDDRLERPIRRPDAPAVPPIRPADAAGERVLSRVIVRADDAPAPVQEPSDALRDAVLAVARARGAAGPSGEVLRERLAAYVGRRRDEGEPVERLIPEIRALVREVAPLEPWYDASREGIAAQVVRWTIEAYYDEPAQTLVPRFY